MSSILTPLFTLRHRVPRAYYAKVGVTLILLKYLVDATAIYLVTGIHWTPWAYPLGALSLTNNPQFPSWLGIAMIIWTLPFLWIGVSLSVRRAADAGWSPWVGLAFFVPFLNYAVMLALCVAPSAPKDTWSAQVALPAARHQLRSAFYGVNAGVAIGLLGFALDVGALHQYDGSLFLVTPFVLGATSAFVFNRTSAETMGATMKVVVLSLLLVGGVLIGFALEGLVCLVLALPLGLVLGWMGAVLGREIALRCRSTTNLMVGCLMVPAAVMTNSIPAPEPTYLITTAVTVNAPPDVVWRHVIQFQDIQDRPGFIFRLGLAYPIRARIAGTGVGALRRCEFSTGAFIEPITTWDVPTRLAFTVIQQPPPLQELSPYQHVYAPHLHGFFRSTHGEFLLTPIAGGRTRLEGRTWYQLDVHPRGYWRFIADHIVSRIHERVLTQVAREAEEEGAQRVFSSILASNRLTPQR
ncbi:MAG TPA: DUF805 domain-containing protein [Gemmatimonadaceae bacterium]|jgi:uncharacterized membrane protein YhaH (DUF805 family)|nr:DUF805 domain-containing protein [Gemmatimonadaceae bacterium]